MDDECDVVEQPPLGLTSQDGVEGHPDAGVEQGVNAPEAAGVRAVEARELIVQGRHVREKGDEGAGQPRHSHGCGIGIIDEDGVGLELDEGHPVGAGGGDESDEASAEEGRLAARDGQGALAAGDKRGELCLYIGPGRGEVGAIVFGGDVAERAALVARHRQAEQPLGLMTLFRVWSLIPHRLYCIPPAQERL
jgi:hypothetical protein